MLGSTLQYRRSANLTFAAINKNALVGLKDEAETYQYIRDENLRSPGFITYIHDNGSAPY